MTRRGLAELVAIVAPPACVGCREPLARAEQLVCGPCLRGLPWLRGRRCERCWLERHGPRGCPAADAAWTRAWAPLAYDAGARALVRALKLRGALPVAGFMSAQIAATLPDALRAVDLVVAVPPQRARRRARGFDAAAALAGGVAARLGVPLGTPLVRCDRAPRQSGAGRAARRAAGRLEVRARRPVSQRVLLVDDVHTTGATLDACARALVDAGAPEVMAATYARTL